MTCSGPVAMEYLHERRWQRCLTRIWNPVRPSRFERRRQAPALGRTRADATEQADKPRRADLDEGRRGDHGRVVSLHWRLPAGPRPRRVHRSDREELPHGGLLLHPERLHHEPRLCRDVRKARDVARLSQLRRRPAGAHLSPASGHPGRADPASADHARLSGPQLGHDGAAAVRPLDEPLGPLSQPAPSPDDGAPAGHELERSRLVDRGRVLRLSRLPDRMLLRAADEAWAAPCRHGGARRGPVLHLPPRDGPRSDQPVRALSLPARVRDGRPHL